MAVVSGQHRRLGLRRDERRDFGGAGGGYGAERYGGGYGDYRGGRVGRGDWGRGDWSRGDYGRSDYGREEFGRGSAGFREGRFGSENYGRESWKRAPAITAATARTAASGIGASDEVSSWFGDHDAERRRREDQRGEHRGRGPKNYTRSDDRIREDVNDRLSDDPFVDASNIEVQVSSCEVTLTGTVDSREAKRRAEDSAERVSGVKHDDEPSPASRRGRRDRHPDETASSTAQSANMPAHLVSPEGVKAPTEYGSLVGDRLRASDPSESAFGIHPMLLFLNGASFGAENRVHLSARCARRTQKWNPRGIPPMLLV